MNIYRSRLSRGHVDDRFSFSLVLAGGVRAAGGHNMRQDERISGQ